MEDLLWKARKSSTRDWVMSLKRQEKLNVSKMTVSYWESGTNSISAEQLKRYCDALGVSVQYVLDQTDEEDPDAGIQG